MAPHTYKLHVHLLDNVDLSPAPGLYLLVENARCSRAVALRNTFFCPAEIMISSYAFLPMTYTHQQQSS